MACAMGQQQKGEVEDGAGVDIGRPQSKGQHGRHSTREPLFLLKGGTSPTYFPHMRSAPLPRLDINADAVRQRILPHCRLTPGEVWLDEVAGHVVG